MVVRVDEIIENHNEPYDSQDGPKEPKKDEEIKPQITPHTEDSSRDHLEPPYLGDMIKLVTPHCILRLS